MMRFFGLFVVFVTLATPIAAEGEYGWVDAQKKLRGTVAYLETTGLNRCAQQKDEALKVACTALIEAVAADYRAAILHLDARIKMQDINAHRAKKIEAVMSVDDDNARDRQVTRLANTILQVFESTRTSGLDTTKK